MAIKRGYFVVCLLVIVSMVVNPFAPLVFAYTNFNKQAENAGVEKEGDFAYQLKIGSPSAILESAPLYSEQYLNEVEKSVENKPTTPQLKLKLTPALIIPGEPFTIEWEVTNMDDIKSRSSLEGVHLAFNGSDGVELPSTEKAPQGARQNGNIMSMAPTDTKGKMNWVVNPKKTTNTEGTPNYLQVQLMDGDKEIAVQAVLLAEPSFEVSAKSGGDIKSSDGRMSISIPNSAITENLYMDIRRPAPNTAPSYSKSGNSIEVVAVGEKSKRDVNKFSDDITVTMQYTEADLERASANDLTIFYYDEDTREWWPVATTVDEKSMTISAKVDHLTVFDYGAESWQATRLPNLDAFQVSEFTGAGTYSIDFWTPSAPGGFQPTVSMNYSSQTIDDSVAFTQASWVGMGWSLETGYIERNMHGTSEDSSELGDDTFFLNVGGISSQLLPIAVNGTQTTYATSEQSFWSIVFDSSTDTWEVWDQNGTKYAFNDRARTHTSNSCSSTANLNLTWRWSLSTATDKFDNVITYSYYNQEKSATCGNVVAVYPATITWPNNRYRVVFDRASRADYQSAWADNDAKRNYSTSKLDKIRVQHSADGSTWENIRQYDFTYSASTTNQIYPNFEWSAGDYTLTLVGIQELSGDGSSALPATTFTYGDELHLTGVDNGQGGEVEIEYELWTYLDDDNDDLRSLYTYFGQPNAECSTGYGTSWSVYNGYGSVKCEANMLQLDKASSPIAIAKREFPEFIIKPGGQYQVAILARSISGTSGLEFGFRDGLAGNDVQDSCTLTTTTVDCQDDDGLWMPVSFDPRDTFLMLESTSAYIKRLQFMLMPLYYRVTSRVVSEDTTGQTATYTYTYDSPSPNDSNVSDIVATVSDKDLLYNPSMREYRGNAITRVKNPDNLVSTTWFYQSDDLKGRAYRSLLTHESAYQDFESGTLPTDWTYTNTTNQTLAGPNGDMAVKSVNGSANWNMVLNKTDFSITNGEVIYAQFRVDGNAQVETGIENSSGDFFGVVASAASGVKMRTISSGGTPSDSTTLISSANFESEKMYMLMIFMDADDGFHVRAWEVNDPSNYGEDTITSLSGAVAYRIRQRVNNGTGYLDAYMEGSPISETINIYTTQHLYDSVAGNGITDIANGTLVSDFEDLQVNWSYVSESVSRSFNGDYSNIATKTTYDYNTTDQGGMQYGNLTRSVSYYWNSGAWSTYRGSKVTYVPNAGAHLTALPSRQISLDCTSGACDFSGESGLTSESLYLYDNSATYTGAPTSGVLTGQRVLVEGANYVQTSYAYDTYGNQTQTINYENYAGATSNPSGDTLTYTTTYDPTYHTYAINESNPVGHTLQTSYDYTISAPITVTDANGNVTGATYDVFGRMTKVIAPGDTTASPTLNVTYYDTRIPWQVDLTQKVDSSSSIRISHFYDGLGRKLQTQQVGKVVEGSQANVVVDTQYDVMGRQIKQTVPYSIGYNASPTFNSQSFSQSYTQYAYDDFGRLETTTAPNGNSVRQSYGDNYVTVTDAKSVSTTSYSDTWGRTTLVDAATGPDMVYAYDTLDRLVQVTEGNYGGAPSTSITYNTGGQKRSMTTPDLGTWSYAYDALGNLATQEDARGCSISMAYDDINRLTGKTYSGSGECGSTPSVSYSYDSGTNGLGHRTSMSDGSGSTSYSYDVRGRLLSQTKVIDTETFTSSWTYNSADNPVSMTYPDGEVLNYGYDSQGNLQSITNADSFTYLENMLYDEAGRISEMDLGANILEKNFDYYSWSTSTMGGSLSNMTTGQVGGSTLQDIDYSYDGNGNITEIDSDIAGETSTYTYDALNRLTSAIVNDGSTDVFTEAFGYNSTNGNLQYKGESSSNWDEYEYAASQPHAVTHVGDSENQRYWYDANGNMIRRFEANDEERLLSYDAENRLVSVLPANIPTATPTATLTETPTPTETGTATETLEASLTPTPSETLENSETPTETLEFTYTPSETLEFTYTPSETPTPSETLEFTYTPSETQTPSETLEFTFTPTETPEQSDTPTVTPTMTYTPSDTATETNTPTITYTPSDTATATDVPTSTDTPTITYTPSDTATATNTATSTFTPSNTATATDTSTSTRTATSTYTPSNTATATNTSTSTRTATATNVPPTATFAALGSTINVCSTTYFTRSGTITQYTYLGECNLWLINGSITSKAALGSFRQFKLRYWDYNGGPNMTIKIDGTTVATVSTDQYGCGNSGCIKTWTSPVYDYGAHTIQISSSGSNYGAQVITVQLFGGAPTSTPTATLTYTPSATRTQTPTITQTPTNTSTCTVTNTVTNTSTITNTPSETPTETFTLSPTITHTFTATNTATETLVPTETSTSTLTATAIPVTATFVANGSAVNVCSTTYFTRSGTTVQYTYLGECNIWLVNGSITSTASLGSYRQFVLRYWDYEGGPNMSIKIDGTTVATISTDQYNCGSNGCIKTWTSPVYDYGAHTIQLSSSGSTYGAQVITVQLYGLAPTSTPTATLTNTATATHTNSPTATATETNTPTETLDVTLTFTDTPTITDTPTETATYTPTMTVSAIPTEEPPGPFSSAYYTYDGDDNMVMSVINGVTTYYASSSYVVEVDGSDTTVRKTYSAGSTSLAVRTIVNGTENTLNWMLGDHLGSSSITTAADGTWNSEIRYSAFGETRYSSGITPTDYRYTGQLEQADVNLYYYNARYYDAALGRFVQADTIIPGAGDSKSYDRYAYVNNNPIIYIDPSGHVIREDTGGGGVGNSSSYSLNNLANEMNSFILSKSMQFASYNPVALVFKPYVTLYNNGKNTYNAWQSGERNPMQLYFEISGINTFLDSTGASIAQMNSDYDTLTNKDAPVINKVMPFTRISSFIAETSALIWAGGKASSYAKASTSSTSTQLTVYDPVFAAQQTVRQTIQNGCVSVSRMEAIIKPSGAKNTFTSSATISSGFKYKFNLNNVPVEFKWHSPDARAFNLYGSSSNSGTMWTAQITVDGKLLGVNMQFYARQMGNLTHIPITQ